MTFESEIIEIIKQVGFPIFVSMWFMIRNEKTINNNTKALNRLLEAVNKN